MKAYAEATPRYIVTRFMRYVGFVATIIYDGSSIKVVSNDKEIEIRLSELINLASEWTKNRHPIPSGEISKEEANIAAQAIMLYPGIKEIKTTSDELFLIERFNFLALYKKSSRSEIEVLFEKKEDCRDFFYNLLAASQRTWAFLSRREKHIWRRLNNKYPAQKRKSDYECKERIFGSRLWFDFMKSFEKFPGGIKKTEADFIYDFSLTHLLKNEKHIIHPNKKEFFKRVLDRIWEED